MAAVAANSQRALRSLGSRISSTLLKASRYTDLPALYQAQLFRQLSSEFYNQLWREAAHNIGAEFERLEPGYICLSRGDLVTVVRGSEVMADNHLTLDLMGNKILTVQLLKRLECPIHDIAPFDASETREMGCFLHRQGGPIVVKPAYGTGGGAGVTTGVSDITALRKAVRSAARYCHTLVLQRHIPGASYRLLLLDGTLVDAVRRDPPVLIGNGTETVRKLIRRENRSRLNTRPISALHPIRVDQDCRNQLRALGHSLNSVLGQGQVVEIKSVVNENAASQNHSVRDSVHPTTVDICARVVRGLSIELAGIDVQCNDISRPLGADNGAILEVNTTPGLHHHYLVSDRAKGIPVAQLILQRIFDTGRGAIAFPRRRER